MNKYLRAIIVIPFGFVKTVTLKVLHPKAFKGVQLAQISPFTEITIERGASLVIGKGFKMRDGAKIRVRKGARLVIGENVSVNSNNIIVCRESIVIGGGVEFSPNVQVYDHDHDYRATGGINAKVFKTSPISIGNNVWIGCNSVVLRGASIGNNSVIAAGSIVKSFIKEGAVFIQKK